MRKAVAAIVALSILACALSVLLGPPEGKRLGYQIMTARSGGLSWLVIALFLAILGGPFIYAR